MSNIKQTLWKLIFQTNKLSATFAQMFYSTKFVSGSFYWVIVLIASIVLIPFTGNVHLFDWDEINFAECAREMIIKNSYHNVLINFQPFWEKPPLFIWMQVLSMKLFGINEWAARFPNIFNGIITLCLLYYWGKKKYSAQFGILWSAVHLGTILPHLYFRSGIIDPWYNFFGFVSLLALIEFFNDEKLKWMIISGFSMGLALLTKGPAMILIVGMSSIVFFFVNKQSFHLRTIKYLLAGIIVFILTGGSWFFYEYISGHTDIIHAFIEYQIRLFKTEDSGHGGFFFYHFVVIFLGCFPASVIMLRIFSKEIKKDMYAKAMIILFWVVLIIFSVVKTKIVHYSSMAYYPVSFLASYVLYNKNGLRAFQKKMLLFFAIIIGLAIVLAGTVEHWKDYIIPALEKSDIFAAENLKVHAHWYGFEFLLGIVFILIIIWYIKVNHYAFKTHLLFFGLMIVWIFLVINNFVGKVEQYSQGSAIVFFEYCAEKKYMVDTYGYKSYASMFYGKRMPLSITEQKEVDVYWQQMVRSGYEKMFSYNLAYLNWLMSKDNEQTVFLVSKIQDEKDIIKFGGFLKLYSKGGYSFFVRYGNNK